MKTRHLTANPRGVNNFPSYLLSDVVIAWSSHLATSLHFIKNLSCYSGLKNRKLAKLCTLFSSSGVFWRSSLERLVELMRRALAPLRRIVSRDLEIFRAYRNGHHEQFAVHDRLECGHVHTSLIWDVFDLLDAYTEAAHVRAVRHRCAECKTLTAKKPVQSVTLAKVKVA